MTEKNTFVYKLFMLLNISDLSLFFGDKNCNSPEKVTPSFPATSLSKLRSCQAPLFENLVGGSPPPAEMGVARYESVIFTIMRKPHRNLKNASSSGIF